MCVWHVNNDSKSILYVSTLEMTLEICIPLIYLIIELYCTNKETFSCSYVYIYIVCVFYIFICFVFVHYIKLLNFFDFFANRPARIWYTWFKDLGLNV